MLEDRQVRRVIRGKLGRPQERRLGAELPSDGGNLLVIGGTTTRPVNGLACRPAAIE